MTRISATLAVLIIGPVLALVLFYTLMAFAPYVVAVLMLGAIGYGIVSRARARRRRKERLLWPPPHTSDPKN